LCPEILPSKKKLIVCRPRRRKEEARSKEWVVKREREREEQERIDQINSIH
jgi:hypothetical protein